MTVSGDKTYKRSIKNKVALSSLLVSSLFTLLVSWALYGHFHTVLQESIFKQQYAMAGEVATQIEKRVQLARQELSLLVAEITPDTIASKSKLEAVLSKASIAQIIFDAGFLVIDTHGVVIAQEAGSPELVGTNLMFRDYVAETLKTGKPLISAPFRKITPPYTPWLAFTYPVRDNHDNIICLIVGYHSLVDGQFLTSLSSESFGSKTYLYMLSGRTILTHQDSSRIMEVIGRDKNQGIDKAINGFEGSLENINSRGVRLLSSFKKVDGTDWIVSVNTPYNDAFAPLRNLIINSLAIVSFGVLLSCLIIWYVTSRLTKPITQITEHIEQSRDGAVEWEELKITTGDELQNLAESYNAAVKDVQQARYELKAEKDFMGSVIQNAATPMFILDRSHKIIYWNNALAKLTGKSTFQMVGTRLQWQPFYNEKRPVMADLIIDHAVGAQVDMFYEISSKSILADGAMRAEGWYEFVGEKRYLFFEAAPIKNRNNEIIAAVETLEDITDRRLMEESLSRLTCAVEQSPATIVMTDKDGVIEYVNPRFTLTTGYTFEEAIGKNPRILKSGEMDAAGYQELWSTLIAGREWRGEFHNKRKDGTLFWEFATISPLFDKDGKINGYLAVKEDITVRKAAEAELAASRAELLNSHEKLGEMFKKVSEGKREWEETLDHLNDVVILTDGEHLVRRYNKLLSDITGKTFNELLGKDWRELLTDAGFTFVSFNGSIGELHHAGSNKVYDIKVYEIRHGEVLEGLVISLNDTTELRATTAELQKAYAELKDAQLQIYQQEKMASIGQLAAGVAHEINNPMGFINSNLGSLDKYVERISEYLRLIDEECSNQTSNLSPDVAAARKRLKIDRILDDAHQLIVESQDGAARVRRIVQDLKSFSRVDQAERALVNLNEALETTINIAWNEIKYVATMEREFGEIPDILCYPQQLNQVFLNLIVNAAHALGTNQGVITVKTWQEEEKVCVSVSDTGCGIAEEHLNKIFEPFFTTKEVGKGTGLGLSISFDIIKKHGGEIQVQSEIGRGTTFVVCLPIVAVEADSE